MFKEYFWDVITKHYADFSGRATRKQFWMFFLFNCIICLIFYCGYKISGSTLFNLWYLFVFLPFIAITERRVRDAGMATLWCFVVVFLCVVGILAFVIGTIFFLFAIFPGSSSVSEMEQAGRCGLIGFSLIGLSVLATIIICSLPSKKVLPSEQPNEQIK